MLLTRPPLEPKLPCDLHALGTPPAFILSQDQTLQNNQATRYCRVKSLHPVDGHAPPAPTPEEVRSDSTRPSSGIDGILRTLLSAIQVLMCAFAVRQASEEECYRPVRAGSST